MVGGGVHHEGHLGGLPRMGQDGGGGEGVLGRLEGPQHGGRPVHRRLKTRAANQGVVERAEDGGGGGDETAVEVDGPQERHQLLDGAGAGMELDGGEAASQGGDAGGRHVVAEEVQLGDGELALLRVDDQASLAQTGEDVPEVGGVLLGVGAGDQDVVQVGETRRAGHHPVHQALEGVSGIPHAERHPGKFEEAKGRDDGGLRDVGGVHRDLMVALPEVDLGEDASALQSGHEVHHVGQRVAVRDGDAVEAAIVAAGAPVAVRLAHHVEWRGPWAVGPAGDAVLLQGGELGLGGGELLGVQAAKRRGDGGP